MPKHVQVSPDEDLSAWGGAPSPTPKQPEVASPAPPPPEAPFVASHRTMVPEYDVEIDEESEISVPRAVPPVPDSAFPAPPALSSPPPVAIAAPVVVAPPPPLVTAPVPSSPSRPVATGTPSPLLCALLSLFFPGAGQIVAGQLTKGLVMLVLALFTVGLCGLLNLLAATDAWLVAQRRRRGESLGEWQFF